VEPADGRVPVTKAAEAKRDYDLEHSTDSPVVCLPECSPVGTVTSIRFSKLPGMLLSSQR
jgi:hypothetical protein